MSGEDLQSRLRELEMKCVLLEAKLNNNEETIKRYTTGIGRVFWIIGTVSITSVVTWVLGGGLK